MIIERRLAPDIQTEQVVQVPTGSRKENQSTGVFTPDGAWPFRADSLGVVTDPGGIKIGVWFWADGTVIDSPLFDRTFIVVPNDTPEPTGPPASQPGPGRYFLVSSIVVGTESLHVYVWANTGEEFSSL